jgi:hypothetical protein
LKLAGILSSNIRKDKFAGQAKRLDIMDFPGKFQRKWRRSQKAGKPENPDGNSG